jgi:hypothetical protein
MDSQNKEKLSIRINAKKIMQELMNEKMNRKTPFEKLLRDESKSKSKSKLKVIWNESIWL